MEENAVASSFKSVGYSREEEIKDIDAVTDLINRCIAEVESLKKEKTVEYGENSYVPVEVRKRIFRKHFGGRAIISTEEISNKNSRVGFRSSIKIWVDGNWVEYASGHSNKYYDNVNNHYETVETVSVGRALANLGLFTEAEIPKIDAIVSSAEEGDKVNGVDAIVEPVVNRLADKKITAATVKKFRNILSSNEEYEEDDICKIYGVEELRELLRRDKEDVERRIKGEKHSIKAYDLKKMIEKSGLEMQRFLDTENVKSVEEMSGEKIRECYDKMRIRFEKLKKDGVPIGGSGSTGTSNSSGRLSLSAGEIKPVGSDTESADNFRL